MSTPDSSAMPLSVEIYDTTLRDGAQLEGISLTVDDKLRIAEQLDRLGVHYIEGGWPGSNPKDDEFFDRAQSELELRRNMRRLLHLKRRKHMCSKKARRLSLKRTAEVFPYSN